MQKNLSYEETSRLEDIFDDFVKMKDACLSENEKQESLNDFVSTYRDGDEFESLEQFETAVKNGGVWDFKCDTSAPDDPHKEAERLEQHGGTGQVFNGYKMKTTFWQDFTIADAYGTEAVQDTFNRAFPAWRRNCVYLTELVLVLNWKIYEFYHKAEEAAKHAKEEEKQVQNAKDFAELAERSGNIKTATEAKISGEVHERKHAHAEQQAKKFDALACLYDKLWKEADAFACENLKGEEIMYFYEVTD